jgi:hypothetical protein
MIVYIAFAFYADIGKLSKIELEIDYLTVPLIAIPMTATIILLGLRFHRFLRILDIKNSIKKSMLFYITGLSLAVTPASSGQIIKSQIMKRIRPRDFKDLASYINRKMERIMCFAFNFNYSGFNRFNCRISIDHHDRDCCSSIFINHNEISSLFNPLKKIIFKFPRLKAFEESIENSQDSLRPTTTAVYNSSVILTWPLTRHADISLFSVR